MPALFPPALSGHLRVPLVAAFVATACLFAHVPQAQALNEVLPRYEPAGEPADDPEDDGAVERMPLPDGNPGDLLESSPPQRDMTRPDTSLGKELPEIIRDLDRLPEPVRRMRQLIVDACRSGDLEKLRPLIGTGQETTQLSLGGLEGDPVEFLREISGDEQGQEILAILLEVMESGFVHLNAGTAEEHYVWPYFFALPLEALTPEQRVELFTIVTAGDYEGMKDFGAYIFYRSAITPDGRWQFFVAGD